MTITCLHCGPINVKDAATVAAARQVLDALSVGAAPLGAITCPLCRDEVRSSAVKDTGRVTAHDCDEDCRGCEKCYIASGDTRCDRLCPHREEVRR